MVHSTSGFTPTRYRTPPTKTFHRLSSHGVDCNGPTHENANRIHSHIRCRAWRIMFTVKFTYHSHGIKPQAGHLAKFKRAQFVRLHSDVASMKHKRNYFSLSSDATNNPVASPTGTVNGVKKNFGSALQYVNLKIFHAGRGWNPIYDKPLPPHTALF